MRRKLDACAMMYENIPDFPSKIQVSPSKTRPNILKIIIHENRFEEKL
jgi:hypothetical protein